MLMDATRRRRKNKKSELSFPLRCAGRREVLGPRKAQHVQFAGREGRYGKRDRVCGYSLLRRLFCRPSGGGARGSWSGTRRPGARRRASATAGSWRPGRRRSWRSRSRPAPRRGAVAARRPCPARRTRSPRRTPRPSRSTPRLRRATRTRLQHERLDQLTSFIRSRRTSIR